jgi:hypothetical protein
MVYRAALELRVSVEESSCSKEMKHVGILLSSLFLSVVVLAYVQGTQENEDFCPQGQPLDSGLGKDLQDNANIYADGINALCAALENRLTIIESNLESNNVQIKNTKYSDLIIDTEDQQTFDYSLHGTKPVAVLVGSLPQKLHVVVPKGPVGPVGPKGLSGGTQGPGGIRGAVGKPGVRALPEQYSY